MRNFAFPGYTKLVWTQSAIRARQPLRRGRKGLHRLATGGYGRWTRIVCCQAPVAGAVGLTEDLSLALDVIPQDEAIEIVAAGEEHPPLGLLGHAVRKTDVFLGLRPTRNQKHIDSDPVAATLDRFSHRLLLGPRIGRIQKIEHLLLEMGRRKPIGDQDDLLVGRVNGREILPSQSKRMLDVGKVRGNLNFADPRVAHVGLEPDDRIVDRHGLKFLEWKVFDQSKNSWHVVGS